MGFFKNFEEENNKSFEKINGFSILDSALHMGEDIKQLDKQSTEDYIKELQKDIQKADVEMNQGMEISQQPVSNKFKEYIEEIEKKYKTKD